LTLKEASMRHPVAVLRLTCLLSFLCKPVAAAQHDKPPVVFRGATVLTVSHGEISQAELVVSGGKILAIGRRGEVAIPDGASIHDVSGKVIIPGLVDTHSHIGIYPRPSIEAHRDGNEMTGAVQPGLRAMDAIWPGDPGIRMATAGGVTTANIMPGSGNAIGGQTLYVKLRVGTLDQMMFVPGRPEGGLKMANGENPKRSYGPKNQPPSTRMRLAALQREQFIKARDYQRKWQSFRDTEARGEGEKKPPPERDIAMETLVEVLERKRTVHFHSHRADDIRTVLRLADEFGFEVVLQHGTEAYKIADELANRHVPVSLTLPDSPGGKAEVADFIEQAAAMLTKAGVKVAVNSDDSITESRFLLRTAAITVRGGLSEDLALKTVTLWPAEMLHLDRQIGSIEPGKDADFVLLSGRPFSVYTQVLSTYIDGVRVYDRSGDDVNYAIGGFALADPSARPKPMPTTNAAKPAMPQVAGTNTVPSDVKRFAVRAGRIDTAAGQAIGDGLIVIDDGRILFVGKPEEFAVPDDTPQLYAAVVTPGLIDAHTALGVSGFYNTPSDQDQDEMSDPNQADARVLDSFNPREPLLRFALEHGVTIVQACPGRANVIAGQAGIFRTHGRTADAMTLRFPSAMLFNLGEIPKSSYPGKAPGTRMATAALIRSALTAAANYKAKQATAKEDSPVDRNAKHEALAQLLDRKIPAIFSAHRADDIETALRLMHEFQLAGQLDLATEGYLLAGTIARSGIPVLLHPTMQRVSSTETMHTTLTNAATLAHQGVRVAITSAFEGYVPKTRVPLYEAAIAAVNGLGYDRALRAVTSDAARILGIDRDYGSLERGKVADLVLYDGDPFEYSTHVTHTVMDGRLIYDRSLSSQTRANSGESVGLSEWHCCDFAF
jgi:imidazolonepropionase-like amidohydrolase